ncbi:polysaccharide biosynthesis tyrosine autokinase [Proteiniborus sp. MB09-C3]|uniref:polysaccharide biosynthesis tyrosine autokinase n=1 Tax=Proteiniborus sp. MB09-C3 TaxID=3050072 RepID=UPI00255787F2|nr:polysaccharide biosynthesis tyrosine autokinase [Proteiniborus sp. MB09-C3]WIV12083.1 polysaccharide biosynthesis tyrosine autokinase [Proteiniborus sp. MB09-C3]
MEEIKLKEYFYIIWKRLWIIILITILFLAASGLVSYFVLVPEYETFTTLMLGKQNMGVISDGVIQYDDLLVNQKLASTYGEIMKSKLVSNEVIENLGLNLSTDQLGKKTNVSLVKDTGIIKIVVDDKSPELAARIVNEIAEVFKKNIANIMKIENIQIIDKAEVPIKPVRPRPILNMAIAGALGFIISITVVTFLDYIDNTIKTAADVEKYLELPVIGMIPISSKQELIANSTPKSPVSEAYRTLRTNIQFSNVDENIKSIVITSSSSNEGKSTIISNLAITVAQTDKKILLIDTDLRKPRIHEIFGISNSDGITNILSENLDYKAALISTGIGGLDILASGPIPPNPAELLGSKKMKDFLESVKDDYDMVLLDAPPVGLVTDATVLSAKCDGVMIVSAVGQSIINLAIDTKKLIQIVNGNILGVVMNKIPLKKGKYYNYHYL